jgi:hypothetical protein
MLGVTGREDLDRQVSCSLHEHEHKGDEGTWIVAIDSKLDPSRALRDCDFESDDVALIQKVQRCHGDVPR